MRLIDPDALAAVTVFQEAEGQTYALKLAVAEVIRRRMARRYMSDGTIDGTVLAAYQFSGMNAGAGNRIRSFRIDDTSPTVMDCQRAWSESRTSNVVPDAVLYYSPAAMRGKPTPAWAVTEKFVTEVDGTLFYRA